MGAPLIALTGRKRSGKDTAAAHLTEHHGYEQIAFADPIKDILEAIDPFLDGERATGSYLTVRKQLSLMDELGSQIGSVLRIHATPMELARSMDALGPFVTGTIRLSDALHEARLEMEDSDGNPWDLLKEDSPLIGKGGITAGHVAEIRRLQQVLGTEAVRDVYGEPVWTDHALYRAQRMRAAGTPVVITDCRFDIEARAVREAGGTVIGIQRPNLGPARDLHASESGVNRDLIDQVIVNDGTIEDLHFQVHLYSKLDGAPGVVLPPSWTDGVLTQESFPIGRSLRIFTEWGRDAPGFSRGEG